MSNHQESEDRIYAVTTSIWKVFRGILIYLVSFMVLAALVLFAVDFVKTRFLDPVDPSDDSPVLVEIPYGSGKSTIARILAGNGETGQGEAVIRSEAAFKLYVDLYGYASKLKAGDYVMNRTMTMEEILEKISEGDGKSNVTNVLIIEGNTVEEIARRLYNGGLVTSSAAFRDQCNSDEYFNYSFIGALDQDTLNQRQYILEGYLFPDTYEIYVGSSVDTIIRKALKQFGIIWDAEKRQRAEELGMTTDEIVTLASIIEKEGRPEDFAKISAIFHNRLNKDMRLQSCATIQYVLRIKRLNLTDQDTSVRSPYNTYMNAGLPVGPICNPSEEAILAALYPDEQFLEEGYEYFCSMNPTDGSLAFAKTLDEHETNVEKYRPAWIEYDESISAQD